MAQVTLDLPEVLSTFLAASGQNLERAALEAIALEAYREGKLSTAEMRRLLGYRTRARVHAFLKEHGVYLPYGLEDLEHDREAGNGIFFCDARKITIEEQKSPHFAHTVKPSSF